MRIHAGVGERSMGFKRLFSATTLGGSRLNLKWPRGLVLQPLLICLLLGVSAARADESFWTELSPGSARLGYVSATGVVNSYTASCSDGTNTLTGTASSSPVTVSGLTNGVGYTCTVVAENAYGSSAASSATSSITPEATS